MMPTDRANVRPNGHDRHHGLTDDEERCPFCLSPIAPSAARTVKQRILAEEQRLLSRLETAMKQQFAKERAQAEVEAKAAIEKVRRDALKAAEAKTKLLREGQAGAIAAALEQERKRAAKKLDDAVAGERLAQATEKARLETLVSDLQRRLASRTAYQIGEKPEADLYDQMVGLCLGDRVIRTARGAAGGDVLIEVLHQPTGAVAGRILLDSKAHARWSGKFTAKLASDAASANADFCLLVTSGVMPAGEHQICVSREGVIVTVQERVAVLVRLLRKVILDNFTLKLSIGRRDEKAQKLLDFVCSPVCTRLFDRLANLVTDLEALSTAEEKSHRSTWNRRASIVEGIAVVHDEFVQTVAGLLGEPADGEIGDAADESMLPVEGYSA